MTLERDTCERTRTLISTALDEELSELEHNLLRAHRRACVNCEVFAREIAAFTEALRREALEPLTIRTAVPRRRRSGQRIMRIGATAAAAVVAVGLGISLSSNMDSSPGSPSTSVSLGAASISLPVGRARVGDPQEWPGGLPRVKASELPRPIGQRAVDP
jgi:predicted anti-sigma-YlaC factor YlaD